MRNAELETMAVAELEAEVGIGAVNGATEHESNWRSRGLVLAAAMLWSTNGFFVKAPFFAGWPGAPLAFWRALFACLVVWPLAREARFSWKLVPMALMFAGTNYTFLTAMTKGSAANAIWLQSTAPVWVLLVGVFVFGERAERRDWLMVALAAIGVGVILHYESRGAAVEAVAWGLVSGLFFAGNVLSLRYLRTFNPAWLAGLNHLTTATLLAPLALAGGPWPSERQWLLLAAFGVFQIGVPSILFARALRGITGHEASGIALLEPLLVPLWVFLAWGDRPAWWTLAGGSLILLGLAIRYLEPWGRKR